MSVFAFVAPEISKSSQITQFDYGVIFNLDSSHTSLGIDITEKGFISRAYGLEGKNTWCSGWTASVNHLAANDVNAFKDEWARTDIPPTGYPFDAIGSSPAEDFIEPGVLFAIDVTPGDIWGQSR
jgi:hypothetical protein